MTPALLLAAALSAAPAPGRAAEASDPRIASVPYDAGRVVRLEGVLRTALQIQFAPDETIRHVAAGDSAGWEIAAEGSLLFLKPLSRRAPTNLIVTTATADGGARHYAFELAVRPDRSSPAPTFVLRFRYPDDERAAVETALAAEARSLETRVLQLRLERGVLEGPRNLAYELQGSGEIAPSEVSDNGRFTVLRFPGGQAMPAVYGVTPDGAERLVPFDVRGEFLVVHGTGPQFRLRRGRAVLCILNRAFNPQAGGAPNGAASSDVQRTVQERPR